MGNRRTDEATLIEAVRILSRTIQTDDGVISACLAEVATRMAELVEERRSISTLLQKVESLEAENNRLREERHGSTERTSLRLLRFLREDSRSRKLSICCASIKSAKDEDAIGALNFSVEDKPLVVNFLWEDNLLGDIDRAITSAIFVIENGIEKEEAS